MERNIFEIANKRKFRFQYMGLITVEDLYDLSKEQLNAIYQSLNESINATQVTLLDKKSNEEEDLDIMIMIVQCIFDEKVELENALSTARETYAKKQKIMQIISAKQDEDLASSSIEDLQNMLDEL